jgi:peptidoglycan lytic transglycosylase A
MKPSFVLARRLAAALGPLLLAACHTTLAPERSCPPPAACPACPACPGQPAPAQPTPPAKPLQPAAWGDLPGWGRDDPRQALPALRNSCGVLTKQPRWKTSCDALLALGPDPETGALRQLLEQQFTPWQAVNPDGSRDGLITGYYEPLIKGSRARSAHYAWPIRGVPEDMLTIDLGDIYPDLKKYRLRGRLVGNKVLPYWSRAELEQLGDRLPVRTLLWAADPIELFFLQVQGSGRVELADGSRVRLGFADQNGQPYQSIGRWLVDKGELSMDNASMDGIKAWARANPARLPELLNANPSYVFFKEMPAGAGNPVGAQGRPLQDGRSIAIDPGAIPLGAPVFLATSEPGSDRPLQRLVVAQDTGGAIKGVVRADLFWGFGAEAGAQAGRMRQQGRMWVLLPKGATPEQ